MSMHPNNFQSDMTSIFSINKFSKTSRSIDNLVKIPKFKLLNVYKDMKINTGFKFDKNSQYIKTGFSNQSFLKQDSKILSELDLLADKNTFLTLPSLSNFDKNNNDLQNNIKCESYSPIKEYMLFTQKNVSRIRESRKNNIACQYNPCYTSIDRNPLGFTFNKLELNRTKIKNSTHLASSFGEKKKKSIKLKQNIPKGIKFEDYTNRPDFNTRYLDNDIVSYIKEKKSNINPAINFSKSLDRDKVNKIYNSPNHPSPCYYEPQYEYILPSLSKNFVNYDKQMVAKGRSFQLYKKIKIKKY